ncbi:hypothetical protein [Clostridium intestinale]|uniref:phage late control D family protein n=1 Tax=Clostridium intestinale TaxID=36845 RepID=UPI002DD645F0|nr:hypothetical protein [Clostridium intestinale]WRY53924.1 hypothetical protein P8F83_12090 [Clostridium intestinale]
MNIIYENVDITSDININYAAIEDSAGGIADSLELIFNDENKLWRQWNPSKNNKIIIKNDNFSSGVMYLDEIYMKKGLYRLKAISTPLKAKTPKNATWENISFSKLAKDLIKDLDLELATYNLNTDWIYERVEQINQNSLDLLNMRCILEGYRLKVSDNKAIIYSENILEKSEPVLKLTEADLPANYEFKNLSSGIYSSCLVSDVYKDSIISYEYKPVNAPQGPILKPKVRVMNHAEAERYSMNLLNFHNKNEITASLSIRLNTNVASGNVIEIVGLGNFSGKYFVEKTKHYFTEDKTSLKARKLMEG